MCYYIIIISVLINKGIPTLWRPQFHPKRLKFDIAVECVCLCLCEGVCLCSCNVLKVGVAMGVASCKKVHNFQMESQTCTRFSVKICHEPNNSQLTFHANCQKGGVAVGVACNKKVHNLEMDSCNVAKFYTNTYTDSFISHGWPLPYTLALPPSVTHQLSAPVYHMAPLTERVYCIIIVCMRLV